MAEMNQASNKTASQWLAHLSLRRIITSNRFIPEVDGFRFLAILIVVIAHTYVQCAPPIGDGPLAQLFRSAIGDGRHGVYLFFTISGFILALPFARHHLEGSKPVAIGSYFKRRITRLEPPYVIVMLIRAAILVWYKSTALGALGVHLLASLFYVHSLVFGQYPTINPPAWSLEVEIQFYLLAPVLTAVFIIRPAWLRRFILVAVILCSGLAATIYIPPISRMSLTLLNYFQYFAAGFLLCDLYLTRTRLAIPAFLWDVIGVLSLGWILFNHGIWYPVILPFITLFLYMAGFFGKIVRGFFSIPVVSIIGGMCYSIYLTHTTVVTSVHALLISMHAASYPAAVQVALTYGLCLGGILMLGTVFFVLIERPCMNPHWPSQLRTFMRRPS